MNNKFVASAKWRFGLAVFMAALIPLAMWAGLRGDPGRVLGLYAPVALLGALLLRGLSACYGRMVIAMLLAMLAAGTFGRGDMVVQLATMILAHLFLPVGFLLDRPRWKHVLIAGVAALAVNAALFGWLSGEVSPREEVPVFWAYAVLATIITALAGGVVAKNRTAFAGAACLVLAGFLYMHARYAAATPASLLASLAAYYTAQMLLAVGAWNPGGACCRR
ncbi:MAG: hypothetical protein GX580_07795 [Candidatus Hydrogenedens sp.]|nr:hypothetical protein [Candidatus Hydrogenedentota bacterium]NLF57524.1 hypothetical protein [Candidatus Hydrogenedens sp.]